MIALLPGWLLSLPFSKNEVLPLLLAPELPRRKGGSQ
jgi:hypothetical protein